MKTNRFNAVVNIYDNVVATIYSNFFENSKLLQIAANIFRDKIYYKIVSLLQMYENINNDNDDVMVDDGDHLVAEIEIPYAPDQTVVDLPILAEPLPSSSSAWTIQIIEEFCPLFNSEKKENQTKTAHRNTGY